MTQRPGADHFAWNRRHVLSGLLGAGGAAVAAPLFGQVSPPQMKRTALCVGIDTYRNIRPLERAVADARSVGERLTKIGYRTSIVSDAGVGALLDGFGDFLGQLDSDTAAFLFIAGHGIQVEGRNYFLPADVAALTDPDALSGAVVLDSLLADVARARPRQTIVILDACRNPGRALPPSAGSPGLASTVAPGGFFIAYSAGSGEYALDKLSSDDKAMNGLFTRHFVDQLRGDALIYDVINRVRQRVAAEAGAIGHSQHPAVYDQARHPYQVNGGAPSVAALSTAGSGSMRGTGVVIAAAQQGGCGLTPFRTPASDARRLESTCNALGAQVTTLFEPSARQILEACEVVAAQEHERLAFFWTGEGGMIAQQACLVRPGANCRGDGPVFSRAGVEWDIDLLSQGDIIAAFRKGKAASRRDHPDAAPVGTPIHLFFDACLFDMGKIFERYDFAREPSLEGIRESETSDISVLMASTYFQSALDTVDGQNSSPFVTALLNAFAIPGLTMAALGARVREEVETLTVRRQTPQLFAGPRADKLMFVQPG